VPRPERLPSIPFGWYYLALRSVAHRRLVAGREDLAALLEVLQATLRRQSARLHAGCISERDMHLVLQLGEEPLESFTRRLQHDYAREFNRAHDERGSLFRLHYQAFVFEHPRWLVRLMHDVHWRSRRERAADESPGLRWSSDAVYRGIERRHWVTTNVVLRMLAHGAYDRRKQEQAYSALMDRPPEAGESFPFRRARGTDSRILGDADFIDEIWKRVGRSASARRRGAGELDAAMSDIAARVIDRFLAQCDARLSGPVVAAWRRLVTLDNVRSGSRKRPLPMVRALCASCLIERRMAKAQDVARFLRCGAAPVSARRRRFYARLVQELLDLNLDALCPRDTGPAPEPRSPGGRRTRGAAVLGGAVSSGGTRVLACAKRQSIIGG
jgi:hypothetical protein